MTGDVVNKTYFEVPTNTTIRDVVFGLGGGVADNQKFKAVQIGGTSGGFIPESLLDTPIDLILWELLGNFGFRSSICNGRNPGYCDVVTRIAKFFQHESCGKCTPCREGTKRMHELMEKMNSGQATVADFSLVDKLGNTMKKICLCGLGQAAPVPVLSTIKHFGKEYNAKLA